MAPSPNEVKLFEAVLDESILDEVPDCLLGDKAYDSDKLDERLRRERGLHLIAPHRAGRKVRTTPVLFCGYGWQAVTGLAPQPECNLLVPRGPGEARQAVLER